MTSKPLFTLAEVLAIVKLKRPYSSAIPMGVKADRAKLAQRFKEIAEARE